MPQSKYFLPTIFLLALSYFLYEFFLIPHEALAADEFVFARHIYEYTFHLPYRDFAPYKSVLGHYLLSIPLFFSHTLFDPIFYMKDEIALINTICIALAAFVGVTLFDKRAVVITLLALLANHYFLIYSTDLRVDMLSSWCCLFAALSFLKQRIKLSGCLLGFGFLISQKAIWYIAAMNGSLLLCIALFQSHLFSRRHFITFNLAIALPVITYLIVWSFITTPALVFQNFFHDAYIQAGIDFYSVIYFTLWKIVMSHGPLLFLFWPLTFVMLFKKHHAQYNDADIRRIFIISFAFIALLLFICYKQPFPYNFVFTFPAFFLLYAEFFSWLDSATHFTARRVILYGIFIIAGIIFPLTLSLRAGSQFNGHYQQSMISLAASITEKDGDYLAGIPFIFKKEQPIHGMKNLIALQIEFLYAPSEKLAPLLLPSLYLTPTSSEQVLQDLERARVKVILTSFRTEALPPAILSYLHNHYQHYYGSIYIYSPVINAKQLSFFLKFSGRYRIESALNGRVLIDGHAFREGQIITLKQGDHITHAKRNYRLAFVPDISMSLHPQFRIDWWGKMVKAP